MKTIKKHMTKNFHNRTLLIELSTIYYTVLLHPVFVIKVLAFLLTMLISNLCMYYVFYIKL